MTSRSGIACALLAMVMTLGAAAERPELPDSMPGWLLTSMQNESRTRKHRSVSLNGNAIQLQVPGKITSEPTADHPNFWHFQVDFGAKVDAHCWVTTEPRFMYDALMSTADRMLEVTAESFEHGAIDSRETYFVEAGFLKETPYALLERLYVLEVGDEAAIGLQKARAAQRDHLTFVCEHNELGYLESFGHVFETLVLTAEYEASRDKPYYEEHQVLSIGGEPVGTTTVTMMLDAEGDTHTRINTGLLIVGADTIFSTESARAEYSSPQGQLINAIYSEVDSESDFRQLSLDPDEDGNWQVQGTEKGKEVSYSLGTNDNLLSTLGQMYAIKAALAQSREEPIESMIWHPEIDSTQWLKSSVVFEGSVWRGTRALTTIGPERMATLYDTSGSTVSAAADLGGVIYATERVLLRGAVRAPIAP